MNNQISNHNHNNQINNKMYQHKQKKQPNNQINNQMFQNKQKTNQKLNVKKEGTEDKWTNYIDKA